MTDLLAIGTRKGLWLARSDDDRRSWTVDGPHLLAQEVAAVSIDTRRPGPRLLAGIQYGHWGPTVMWSDDLGATWTEEDHAGLVQLVAAGLHHEVQLLAHVTPSALDSLSCLR